MSCFVCQRTGTCEVDCANAPWNVDSIPGNRFEMLDPPVPLTPIRAPRRTLAYRLAYLKRYVKFLRAEYKFPLPLPFRPEMAWG